MSENILIKRNALKHAQKSFSLKELAIINQFLNLAGESNLSPDKLMKEIQNNESLYN